MSTKSSKSHNKPQLLTRKQQAFVQHLVNNPKDSATEAAAQTYSVTNRNTANTIATENMAKPAIQSELSKYTKAVEDTLYNTVVEWGANERPRQREIAQQAAMYIHDKVHGKAKQQIETTNKTITFNINMTTPPTP